MTRWETARGDPACLGPHPQNVPQPAAAVVSEPQGTPLAEAHANVAAFMQDWDRGEVLARSDRRTLGYSDVAALLDAVKRLNAVRDFADMCAKYAEVRIVRADVAWQLRTILDGDPNVVPDVPVTATADVRVRL